MKKKLSQIIPEPVPLETGAVMPEFVFVCGMVFAVILTFIDFGRIFMMQALLTKGAQQGLAVAEKVPNFGIDLSRIDPADYGEQKALYDEARRQIIEAAVRLPVALNFVGGEFTLFTALDLDPDGTLTSDEERLALVLRPSDTAQDSVNTGSYIFHPDRCDSAVTGCPAAKARAANETMEVLLDEFPIEVQLRAEVDTWSPWLPSVILRGRAMGWREEAVPSGFEDGRAAPNDIDGVPPVNPCDPLYKEACPPGEKWVWEQNTQPDICGCAPAVCVVTTCNEDQWWSNELCRCMEDYSCQLTEQACGPNEVWNEYACECVATGGS